MKTLPYETPQCEFDLRKAFQFQKFLNSDSDITQHAGEVESRYGVLSSRGFIKVPGVFGDQNFSRNRSAIKINLGGGLGTKGAQSSFMNLENSSSAPFLSGVVCN